jgi:hypothetical protein
VREETRLQRQIRDALTQRGFKAVACSNGAVLAGDARQRAIQMNTLKAAGLVPGFPDLIVYGPNAKVGHIEVKLPKEDQSENQIKVQGWMSEWGHLYAVCRSLEDVEDTLGAWGWVTPLRAPDGTKLRPVPPYIADLEGEEAA